MSLQNKTQKTKRKRIKHSFEQLLEKRKTKLEEMRVVTEQVSELRNLLSETIEDENQTTIFSTTEFQNRIPILTLQERELVKNKMLALINKYFK